MRTRLLLFAAGALILGGCAGRSSSDRRIARVQAACQWAVPPSLPRASAPQREAIASDRASAWDVVSPVSRRVATQLGLAPHLRSLALTSDSSALANEPGDARVLADVQAYLQAASMVTAAVAAELDCEQEWSEQIATRLASIDSRRAARLTGGAILAAAGGALASVILLARGNNGSEFEVVGISVAAIETTLGLMLFRGERTVPVSHPDNLLLDVLEGPSESEYFPEPTWQYLRATRDTGQAAASRRVLLLQGWDNEGLVTDSAGQWRPRPGQPYFMTGGSYTAEELRVRAAMLDQTGAIVNLLQQELAVLAVELTRLRR